MNSECMPVQHNNGSQRPARFDDCDNGCTGQWQSGAIAKVQALPACNAKQRTGGAETASVRNSTAMLRNSTVTPPGSSGTPTACRGQTGAGGCARAASRKTARCSNLDQTRTAPEQRKKHNPVLRTRQVKTHTKKELNRDTPTHTQAHKPSDTHLSREVWQLCTCTRRGAASISPSASLHADRTAGTSPNERNNRESLAQPNMVSIRKRRNKN
jgi:hypothetical protein